MKVAEYLVDILIENGVTDVFGIPGGVILDLLYAFDKRTEISSHLSYHEQAAAFEACGYAQVNYTLGVAYATRGPGFTNLITGIADAYADSIPVMFVTAHSGKAVGHDQRFEQNQEIDTVQMIKYITKYAIAIEDVDEVKDKVEQAVRQAMTGRKGPVLLDFSDSLWNKEIERPKSEDNKDYLVQKREDYDQVLLDSLKGAERPVFLLGDGVRQAEITDQFARAVDQIGIPVLASRCAQDVGSLCKNYFGYVGSRGIRYSNFIFAKADLVIALGNRLAFPAQSESFSKALENKKIIWVEIDEDELKRVIPNAVILNTRLENIINSMETMEIDYQIYDDWLDVCEQLKNELKYSDVNKIVDGIIEFMKYFSEQIVFVSDVGNNEFWVSRGYELCGVRNRILYSKSFGALGCGIGKAIGAYYQTKKPVVCFVGDQGFQLNIQELQLIAKEKLPITIFIVNNESSGMIKDRESQRYHDHYVHTTKISGYGSPEISFIAKSYGIEYQTIDNIGCVEFRDIVGNLGKPVIIEGIFDENIGLTPSLPKGKLMQDMTPELNREVFETLEQL